MRLVEGAGGIRWLLYGLGWLGVSLGSFGVGAGLLRICGFAVSEPWGRWVMPDWFGCCSM